MACNQTAIAVLQELCMKRKWNPPMYEATAGSGPSNDPVFEVTVTLCNGIRGLLCIYHYSIKSEMYLKFYFRTYFVTPPNGFRFAKVD